MTDGKGTDGKVTGRELTKGESAYWVVRPGQVNDLEAVVALERILPEAPHWGREVYEGACWAGDGETGSDRRLFVAVDGPDLLGFAVGSVSGCAIDLHGDDEWRSGELETIAVAEPARRRGIARALCGEVLQWCEGHGACDVLLEVREGSGGAVKLYRELGFRVEGRRRSYYRQPVDDALLMRVLLKRGGMESGA